MFPTPARAVRAALATAASLVLVAALGACSDDDSDPDETNGVGPGGDGGGAGHSHPVHDRVRQGQAEARPAQAAAQAGDQGRRRWIDAAYVAGDYPRNDFSDAFKAFSKDAAALAKRDKGLMSNAEVADRVDSVTAKARRLRIDVLADRGKAGRGHRPGRAGARPRRRGPAYRPDRRPAVPQHSGSDWQVFGYDVKRGRWHDDPTIESAYAQPGPRRGARRRARDHRPGGAELHRGLHRRGAGGVPALQGVDLNPDLVWILAVGSDARPGENMTRIRGDALQLVGMNTKTGAATAHRDPARLLRVDPRPRLRPDQRRALLRRPAAARPRRSAT